MRKQHWELILMFAGARLVFPAAAGLIAAVSIAGCSSSDSDVDADPTASVPASSQALDGQEDNLAAESDESGDDANEQGDSGSSVDQLCRQVDQFVEEFRNALQNPSEETSEDFREQLNELSKTAIEVAQDTSLTAADRDRSRQCSEKLATLGAE